MTLKFTNTLSKKKEPFIAPAGQPIKLYVCGVTPYNLSHIGHGRVYVNFDVLVRLLRFLGHEVNYIRNVTDIDDKLINKAVAEQNDVYKYKEIADHFTLLFQQDMHQLNCLVPNHEPRVTECIPEIITFIQGLVDKNHAYVLGSDVYFDIKSFPAYGKLSGRKIEDLLAGVRVEINDQKKNPGDFALWKGNDEGLFWQSPWGHGRPGWHIECSVMAKQHLGITIDIHGGGMDLVFPHHENELAQSEALHDAQFARTWLHNAFVNINKEKMSKSLGNIIALRSIFEEKDPMVLRYFYLQHHYRTPIDYSTDELNATQTAYKKLVAQLGNKSLNATTTAQDYQELLAKNSVASSMIEALVDDLNTPKFLGLVFENLAYYKQDPDLALFVQSLLQQVLGLSLQPIKEDTVQITPEIQALIDARELARQEKNWPLADSIRDQLTALGYQAQDKKNK